MVFRTLILVILVAGSFGCGKDEATEAVSPASSSATPGIAAAPAPAAGAGYRPYEQGDPFVGGAQGGIRVGGSAPPREAAPTEPEAAPAPERDLAGEVRRAFGDPSGCVARSSDVPESVTVTIQVRLTAFGTASSASVAAPGLGQEAIDCLRRQAEGVRVASPVSGAPRSVSTSIAMGRAPL